MEAVSIGEAGDAAPLTTSETASPAPPQSDRERLNWLRLIRSENVGPATFYQLLDRFGSAGAALEALPELARSGGLRRAIHICSIAQAERELTEARRIGASLLARGEPSYPALLAMIDNAPPLLYALGDPVIANRRAVAIVGSRNASAAGRQLAAQIASGLGAQGIAVISGLARGIDGAAHEAALATGTVGVLAGGVDVIYPPEHAQLYRQIAAHGLLLSEVRPGLSPRGRDFPRRNRIISGLSEITVVIEAARASGSLLTARFALDQGREVMAVPGHPLDPRAAGPIALIRDGAGLVTCAEDVLEALAAAPTRAQMREAAELAGQTQALAQRDEMPAPPSSQATNTTAPAEKITDGMARSIVLKALSPVPISVDDLIRHSGLAPQVVGAVLSELDLAGRIERQSGGRVCLCPRLPDDG